MRGVEDPHGRSRYYPNENTILIDFGADFLDMVHEMVHAREARNPALVDAEREFFDHKTETHDKKTLSDLDPLGVHDEDEEAYDVHGRSRYAYLYKDYGDGGAFEVSSFGVESMYRDPQGFRKFDREAFDFAAWVFKVM
ncbi:MAG: hypothetical protein IKG21_05880 [Atopobiaceae bacterium]|nr:hypothetical protein [Atopobiaceae bacterium]